MKINVTPHPTHDGWYYVEYRPDGYKGKRVRELVDSYDAACRRRDKLSAQFSGEKPETTHPRLKDIYAEYLSWAEDNLAPDTVKSKRCRLGKHLIPKIGHLRAKDLSQTVLDEYGRGMAKGSYRDDIYHLLAFVSWMVKRRYAKPLDFEPELPEYHPPVKTIPAPADILVFLENIPKEDQKVLFSLMLYTGLRWNEATHLRWENYEGDSFRLEKIKTKKQKKKFIPEHLQQWFRDNRKDEGWVFSAYGLGRGPYTNLDRMLNTVERKTGIKMTPHLFRHASATFLYRITKDLYAVKNHLDHSRITTTEIYTRYDVEDSRQAIRSLSVHLDNLRNCANCDEQRTDTA